MGDGRGGLLGLDTRYVGVALVSLKELIELLEGEHVLWMQKFKDGSIH